MSRRPCASAVLVAGALVCLSSATAWAGDDAAPRYHQGAQCYVTAGEAYGVVVIMWNTGTTTWTKADGYQLVATSDARSWGSKTQWPVWSEPQVFDSQIQWIAQNVQRERIAIVLHEGGYHRRQHALRRRRRLQHRGQELRQRGTDLSSGLAHDPHGRALVRRNRVRHRRREQAIGAELESVSRSRRGLPSRSAAVC